MYDYHIHSTFSPDGKQTLEEICKKSIELGLKGIAITDHVEREHPTGVVWDFDYKEYVDEITRVKEIYKDKLAILVGVELGMQAHILDQLKSYVEENQFDYIIASSHCAAKESIEVKGFFENRTQQQAYNTYLNEILTIVKNFNNYSVIGHLGYIVRYGVRYCNYEQKYFPYYEHQEIIDQILKIVIENGKGLEVNTSGTRYNLSDMHPDKEILKRYKELGGEIITVGSDAHRVEDIGYKIDEVYKNLKEIGFKYITTFKNQKPEFMKI